MSQTKNFDTQNSTGKTQLDQMLSAAGEMGELIRNFDWSKTAIGFPETWPQSLRTATSIMLNAHFPMYIAWGKDYIQLYNDGYRPILGSTKHPAALGLSSKKTFAESWHIIGPLFDGVMQGKAIGSEDWMLPLDRHGYLEECYFTYSYSPILEENESIGGVLVIVSETTERVLSERRLKTLHDLGEQVSVGKSAVQACQIAAGELSKNQADVPFALIYLLEDHHQAQLAGSAGIEDNSDLYIQTIDLTDKSDTGWPLTPVIEDGEMVVVDDITKHFNRLPAGSWDHQPHTALILPIIASGSNRTTGFLIVGVSVRLALNDDYRHFYELVVGHIATAVANARAFDTERKRAEALTELDRAKTAFFNNVSHEFRTPLTLMLSPLEELLNNNRGQLTPPQQETLQLIQRNGLRLLKLVNTLLDFARIESDRVEVSFEPVDLASFTADLASMFRTVVEKVGLKFIVDCPPLPEPIYIDREMWEKIVLNLLSNAFKFTLEGTISLCLVAFADHVELQVQDTGVGIPESELPNLFDRFYRVRNTQARTYEGSGIGLALVQDLVRLHRGSVKVSSELGLGSIFTVSLLRGSQHLPQDRIEVGSTLISTALGARPYIEEAKRWLPAETRETDEVERLAAVENTDFKSHTSKVLYNSTRNARIIVAEDNADMREYLGGLLSPYWQVETYPDGQRALTAIQKQRPDLVLTDVMMPELDGFGLLRALRSDPATRDLTITLLSARAGEEAIIEGLEAGADDYLVKPFVARELLARINAQLEMVQLRHQILETEQAARIIAEAERERASNLLNSMSDAFVLVDREFRYLYLNPQAQALYFDLSGETEDAFLGRTIWEKFPNSEESIFGETYKRALYEQIPLTMEAFFEPLDTWFNVRLHPVDEGLSIYFQDITQRKHSEKALEQYARDLQRSNKELEQFAYIASHDLQEPLRMVSSYMQLLESRYTSQMDNDAQEFIRFAIDGATRMRNLITDLLAYSKVNSTERQFAPFNSEAVLELALKNLQLEIEETRATITHDPLPTIMGNENQFVQLLQNFTGNAIKFHGKKLTQVHISAQHTVGEWIFSIKDNGIGIKQEHLERIFVMFQRLHTKEQYPGTGIGLAICKKIIEQHGGQIWVESREGEGTTFYFTIPDEIG